MSFGYERPDFLSWRANIDSKGRALLMLFLFSDIGEDDGLAVCARTAAGTFVWKAAVF